MIGAPPPEVIRALPDQALPDAPSVAPVNSGRQPPGFFVTSLPRYFIDSCVRVPSACISPTTLLSAAIIDLSSGPLLSSAKATETVKIGGPSRIRIGAVFAWSARPFALATIASYLRPEATAWTHRLSVSSGTIFGSVGGGSLFGSTMSRLPSSHCWYVVAVPTQMLLPPLISSSFWTGESFGTATAPES